MSCNNEYTFDKLSGSKTSYTILHQYHLFVVLSCMLENLSCELPLIFFCRIHLRCNRVHIVEVAESTHNVVCTTLLRCKIYSKTKHISVSKVFFFSLIHRSVSLLIAWPVGWVVGRLIDRLISQSVGFQ